MPRLSNFSSINAIIDNVQLKNIITDNYIYPYSLNIATTESLPEEGDSFTTMFYVPFNFKVQSISLQINQQFDKISNVKINVCNKEFEFSMSPEQPTLNKSISNIVLKQDTYNKIKIENMKNDEGDVCSCSVFLHGKVN